MFRSNLSTRSSFLLHSNNLPTKPERSEWGIGVWVKASFINHSCYGNCERSFIGDMQIIRATHDIDANTELEFPYNGRRKGYHDYDEVQEELDNWGFKCSCPLCKDAKYTSSEVLQTRKRLCRLLKDILEGSPNDSKGLDIIQAETLLLQLEETYIDDSSRIPRTGAWASYFQLANHYAKVLEQPHRAIRATMKGLEMLGFKIEGGEVMAQLGEKSDLEVKKWGILFHELIRQWVLLWTAFALLGEADRAEQAREIAVVAYRIAIGEDETFEESVGVDARLCIRERILWAGTFL
jgi:SET domain